MTHLCTHLDIITEHVHVCGCVQATAYGRAVLNSVCMRCSQYNGPPRPRTLAPRPEPGGNRTRNKTHASSETIEQRDGLLARFWTWQKAERSLKKHGPVPLHVVEHRRACCTGQIGDEDEDGSTRVSEPCPAMKRDERGRLFCQACGCPEWSAAELPRKWTMPACPCPRGHFSNWIPADQESS